MLFKGFAPSCGLSCKSHVFLHHLQMLQLWRAESSRQRMPAATSAKKVPFLPKHHPCGGQLSNQSTAVVTGISGEINSLHYRRRRGHEPHPLPSRQLWLVGGRLSGKHKHQSKSFNGKLLLELTQVFLFQTAGMNVAAHFCTLVRKLTPV